MSYSSAFFTPQHHPNGNQLLELPSSISEAGGLDTLMDTLEGPEAPSDDGVKDEGELESVAGHLRIPWFQPTTDAQGRPVLNDDKLHKMVGDDGEVVDDPEHPRPARAQQHKKKGTAKTVRAKKGGKAPGGPGKKGRSGGPGSKAKKRTTGSQPEGEAETGAEKGAENDDNDDDEDDDDDDDDESDQGTYCICKGPDDHRFMICCDSCQDWFHGDCVGMDKWTGENLVQQYVCPRCEDPKSRHVTRYKKLCSLTGCIKPCRIYSPKDASVFCSKEHCDAWWEQMVASLPKTAQGGGSGAGDVLTQADFVGLLDKQVRDVHKDGVWKLGEPPFATDKSFWDKVPLEDVLTHEELVFITGSASDRHMLQEEVVLCKKQLQLLDMAAERRKHLISGTSANKELCGYDYHLDAVGATAAFAAFEKSARGQAIFASGHLDPPATDDVASEAAWGWARAGAGPPPGGAGEWVCRAKRCKPHGAWYSGMVKGVRHTMKQLAAEAKEKLEAEMRVQECAAVRYQRKMRESNWVEEVMDTD